MHYETRSKTQSRTHSCAKDTQVQTLLLYPRAHAQPEQCSRCRSRQEHKQAGTEHPVFPRKVTCSSKSCNPARRTLPQARHTLPHSQAALAVLDLRSKVPRPQLRETTNPSRVYRPAMA